MNQLIEFSIHVVKFAKYIFIPILISLMLIYKFDKQSDGSGAGILGWLLFKILGR